jgi:hypothetical protein
MTFRKSIAPLTANGLLPFLNRTRGMRLAQLVYLLARYRGRLKQGSETRYYVPRPRNGVGLLGLGC